MSIFKNGENVLNLENRELRPIFVDYIDYIDNKAKYNCFIFVIYQFLTCDYPFTAQNSKTCLDKKNIFR